MDAGQLDRLARRAQAGDREAFEALVLECQQPLRLSLSWRAPSVDLVEEVLQATFVTAYERLSTYRFEGNLLAWLKGIGRNLLLAELRSRQRTAALDDDLPLDPEALDPDEDDDAELTELTALRACLGELAPRARLLLERRYTAGLPLALIARQFKQKENTLAVTLGRIRARLRQCLDAKGIQA